MNLIRSITAYYPQFMIGGEPVAVLCQLREVEANGRRYVCTPFAMLDCHGADDLERLLGRGYYATAEACDAYLATTYPNWKAAAPIGDALSEAARHYGKMVGDSRVEDVTGLSSLNGELHRAARGERSVTLKTIRAAVAALAKAKTAARVNR